MTGIEKVAGNYCIAGNFSSYYYFDNNTNSYTTINPNSAVILYLNSHLTYQTPALIGGNQIYSGVARNCLASGGNNYYIGAYSNDTSWGFNTFLYSSPAVISGFGSFSTVVPSEVRNDINQGILKAIFNGNQYSESGNLYATLPFSPTWMLVWNFSSTMFQENGSNSMWYFGGANQNFFQVPAGRLIQYGGSTETKVFFQAQLGNTCVLIWNGSFYQVIGGFNYALTN